MVWGNVIAEETQRKLPETSESQYRGGVGKRVEGPWRAVLTPAQRPCGQVSTGPVSQMKQKDASCPQEWLTG